MNKTRHGLDRKFDIDRYKVFRQAEYQARHRGEAWQLTFKDWCEIWPTEDLWQRRGRGVDNLAMTRRDPERAWHVSNVVIMTRLDQIKLRNARIWGKDTAVLMREYQ